MQKLWTGSPFSWALWAATLLLFLAGPVAAQTTSFSRIDVAGNQRIEADTVRVVAGIEPGQRVSPADLNDALQRLFQTGLFEDVELTPTGGRLVITVVENPIINLINFEGNDRIEDEVLRSLISLQPRRAYSRSAAEADAQAIIDAYSQAGRFSAEVRPVLIRLPDNRVNLVFEIFEGGITRISRINFVGNQIYSDRRLRRVIETGQAGLFTGLFGGATFDEDRLELDRQLLRQFYLERGYVDFEVRAATSEISRERNAFFVTFNLFEGPRYRVGEVFATTNARGLDAADFDELINLRPGEVYNARRVERVVERMAFLAGQQGFAFVEVQPRIIRNEEQRTVDIEFELIEGPRVFIERIDITGNTQTLDRVIRRQFRVVEGDAFNAREVREAQERIQALRFFERVEVRVREGTSPDRAVINVDVEDAATGSLTFGAAFSSSDGPAGTVSLTERNFLGRGQRLGIDLSLGTDQTTASLSFTEPALFDQDFSAGFRLFYRERDRDESSVVTRNLGFVPQIGFPLTSDSRLSLRYSIVSDSITGAEADTTSPILLREEGEALTSSVGARYTLDRRNSPVDPSAGFLFSLDQEIAGLGGDQQFSRTEASGRVFASLLEEEVILSAEVEAGALFMLSGDSRLNERFVLGGDSLRGFEFGGLGPRDVCSPDTNPCIPPSTSVDDALGGNFFAVARFEASFPIGLPEELGVFGGVFADIGTVWGLDDTAGASGEIDDSPILRSSVGVSLFWDSAIGPLRINFARPIQEEENDQREEFRFTVDTRF